MFCVFLKNIWVLKHAVQLHRGPRPGKGVASTSQEADAQSCSSEATETAPQLMGKDGARPGVS